MRFSPLYTQPTEALSQTGTEMDGFINNLKTCRSPQEIKLALCPLKQYLYNVLEEERLRSLKGSFEECVSYIAKKHPRWQLLLHKEFTAILVQYFNKSPFRNLPEAMLIEIFHFLPIQDLAACGSVCWEWQELTRRNEIWKTRYDRKFLLKNPNSFPFLPPDMNSFSFYREEYFSRIVDPQVGDLVEVAWRGKFRLETQEIYQGLAWWTAEIVQKDFSRQDRKIYKIHYPGWETRWDEWVSRHRLRWVAQHDTFSFSPRSGAAAAVTNVNAMQSISSIVPKEEGMQLCVGDVVELWCNGHNVPGAWLECYIKCIHHGSICLGRVTISGQEFLNNEAQPNRSNNSSNFLWVQDRQRLRLISRRGKLVTGRGTGFLALQRHDLLQESAAHMRSRSMSSDSGCFSPSHSNKYSSISDASQNNVPSLSEFQMPLSTVVPIVAHRWTRKLFRNMLRLTRWRRNLISSDMDVDHRNRLGLVLEFSSDDFQSEQVIPTNVIDDDEGIVLA